jgi:hypothetical protein
MKWVYKETEINMTTALQNTLKHSWELYVQSHKNNREKFKNKLHRYLITHCFYSVTEFLECKIDKDDI